MKRGKARVEHIKGLESVLSYHQDGERTRHTKLCAACELNCEVRHVEVGFWARLEKLKPKYSLKTCPKQTKNEVLGIKRRR